MAFFDRKSKEKEPPKEEKKVVIPEPWKCAKVISLAEAQRQDELPIGWYIFREGASWYALRPGYPSGKLEKSSKQYHAHFLEKWLGVPVPDVEAKTDSRNDYEPLPAEDEISESWEYAQTVSVDEVDGGYLPIGWYIFEDRGAWYALKPDPYTGHMIESEPADYPEDLEDWLGIPVAPPEPAEQPKRAETLDGRIIKSQETSESRDRSLDGTTSAGYAKPAPSSEPPEYLKRMGLVEEDPTDKPPTDIENRWAEEKLTEQLKEVEAEIRDTEKFLATDQKTATAPTQEKPRKKRQTLGRTNRVQIRLTDAELAKFHRRVKGTGLSQGEFLRNAALNGEIIIQERSMADVALLDELTKLRAELGRQGGLLKMITKPNEGLRQLAPNEWAELMQAIRDMEAIKQRLIELEVKIGNGTRETSKQ